jgi:hypothetical protein
LPSPFTFTVLLYDPIATVSVSPPRAIGAADPPDPFIACPFDRNWKTRVPDEEERETRLFRYLIGPSSRGLAGTW